MQEDRLRAFGRVVQKLVAGHDLSREESYSAFRQVLRNEQPDLHQGAFLASLVTKGETAAEIAGAWTAIDEFDTVHADGEFDLPLCDNCGTGMDAFKTFNASTAASIIAAACGVPMARHGARALTSRFGTVDIAEALGVDVECDADLVARSIRETGIGLFNGMSPRIHPAALGRILSQIRFGSTLNIAASLANPGRPSLAVRGVYAEDLLSTVAGVMRDIGYTRGMLVHGKTGTRGGMDELSVCGETVVHEFFEDGQTATYTIVPETVGLNRVAPDEIASTADLKQERHRVLRVLAGEQTDGCRDFACLNAAAVLHVAGKAADLREGVALSREAIDSGAVLRKLKQWVATQNAEPEAGLKRLTQALADAGIPAKAAGIG
jgi:anthranilate phosphoribosyltransferase